MTCHVGSPLSPGEGLSLRVAISHGPVHQVEVIEGNLLDRPVIQTLTTVGYDVVVSTDPDRLQHMFLLNQEIFW